VAAKREKNKKTPEGLGGGGKGIPLRFVKIASNWLIQKKTDRWTVSNGLGSPKLFHIGRWLLRGNGKKSVQNGAQDRCLGAQRPRKNSRGRVQL